MKHQFRIIIPLLVVALVVAACSSSGSSTNGGETEITAPTLAAPAGAGETADSTATSPLTSGPFQIDPAESEVRFLIDEVLNGQDNTVVGVSDQVSGGVSVDFDNPQAVEIGPVVVAANSFVTDSGLRNRAINRWVLQSADHETINFVTTSISDLPGEIIFGESYSLEIVGDLTIKNISKEVVFQATITPVSETRIEGSASTTISRSDYDLSIPSVPRVASVAENLILEFDFVAVPMS